VISYKNYIFFKNEGKAYCIFVQNMVIYWQETDLMDLERNGIIYVEIDHRFKGQRQNQAAH
jgi:hypothetical protein